MFTRVVTTRLGRVLGGLVGAVLFVVAAAELPAAAAAGATLSLSSAAPATHQGVELTAQVSAASTPLSGVTVHFYVHLEEFSGAPELLIGTAATDATGDASITYQPTWAGTQRFVATAVDATGASLATSALTVQAARTDPFAGPVQSLRPDGLIGRWVVVVLLALVIGVWITLLALVVRVQQGPADAAR